MGSASSTAGGQAVGGKVPETMRRIVLVTPNEIMAQAVLEIETVPVPKPGDGELLIRVEAAPVNPSDYGAWCHPGAEHKRTAIGHEGCGIVVATGGGMATYGMMGKKVGFTGLTGGQGSYSEYVTVSAMKGAWTMPDSMPVEDAASFFVNPYTVMGITDTVRSSGAKSFIHTAAASQLGQMMVKMLVEDGDLIVVNVVRRQAQADTLTALGAKYVVITDHDEWREELKALVKELKVTVAFDAVSGPMAGDLLDILPRNGTLYTYGNLGGAMRGIDPVNLIYHRKNVKGWLLPNWIKTGGTLSTLSRLRSAAARVNAGLSGGWSSSQFVDCTLDDMWDKFLDMHTNTGFSQRKLRIRFAAASEEKRQETPQETPEEAQSEPEAQGEDEEGEPVEVQAEEEQPGQ